jgi:hypothetical protein
MGERMTEPPEINVLLTWGHSNADVDVLDIEHAGSDRKMIVRLRIPRSVIGDLLAARYGQTATATFYTESDR